MPSKPPPFKPSPRFGARFARWASVTFLILMSVFGLAATVGFFIDREGWKYMLGAAGIAAFTAIQLARGGDPSAMLPSFIFRDGGERKRK
jgi:hypothetical protein